MDEGALLPEELAAGAEEEAGVEADAEEAAGVDSDFGAAAGFASELPDSDPESDEASLLTRSDPVALDRSDPLMEQD